jgi:hypothetical protein
VGQIAIRKYQHLGDGIDFGEVERMRTELRDAIKIVGSQEACDSPVYTFLQDLRPPAFAKEEAVRAMASNGPQNESPSLPTIRTLMDRAEAALRASDFVTAKSLFAVVRSMMPMDNFIAQKLALATYKSELPTAEAALNEAASLLESLKPGASTDCETLGLYGAVQRRLWGVTNAVAHLDKAIWAHEKGFNIRNDYYNGINFAFLLNVRAALNGVAEPPEAVADFVVAQRTRRKVLALCQASLDAEPAPKDAEEYWIKATMAEAYAGLGDEAKAQELLNGAKAQPGVPDWMVRTTEEHLSEMKSLLSKSPLDRIAFSR